jgi:hypothetical protein
VKTQIWIAVSVYALVAIVNKRLDLDGSPYTLLQILSVTLFEKMPILQALALEKSQTEEPPAGNQLNLFDSLPDTSVVVYLPLYGVALARSKRDTGLAVGYRYWLVAWPLIAASPVALFFAYHAIRGRMAGRAGLEDIGCALTMIAGFAAYGLVSGMI